MTRPEVQAQIPIIMLQGGTEQKFKLIFIERVVSAIRNCVLETPVWISASFLQCALETRWLVCE